MEQLFLPHLNVQTNSNISLSLINVKSLVEWAVDKRMKFLSISDYNPFETISFFSLCKKNRIKPIWGAKIFVSGKGNKKTYPVTIFPKDNNSYRELIRNLFSETSPADRVFEVDFIIDRFGRNCFVIFEAYDFNQITFFAYKWIIPNISKRKQKNDFKENELFIGFNFFINSSLLISKANIKDLLIPFFSINFFLREEKKIIKAISKTKICEKFFARENKLQKNHYFDINECFQRCTDDKHFFESLLSSWQKIISSIKLRLGAENKSKDKLNENSFSILKEKCLLSLFKLKKQKDERYLNLLNRELSTIKDMNYVDYFLVFGDVVDHLKEKKIAVGPGRGSSVSSLVVYLLGITSIDPIENKLLFERFLNRKRDVLPDIDLDVENQDAVFEYLKEKYGSDKIARFTAKKKFGLKTSIKELSAVFGKEATEKVGRIITFSDKEELGEIKVDSIKKAYPDLITAAESMKNLYYDTAIHPSGIIISKKKIISSDIPLKKENGIFISLLSSENLQILGLKKFDFLSLRDTLELISFVKSHLESWDKKNFPGYSEIDYKDEKTWSLLNNFLLTCIFQLDTNSSRSMFFKLRPKNFNELVIFISLNRPGTRKKVEKIVSSKLNNRIFEKVISTNRIKEILAETYGVIIFEEQMTEIFSFLFDLTLEDAEIKRRNFKSVGDFPHEATLRHAMKTKGMNSVESNYLLNEIKSTIEFTFNKAHAVAYGTLTYYISFIKANYFCHALEFFLEKRKEKSLQLIQEAFSQGMEIELPDINFSSLGWRIVDNKLFAGFSTLDDFNSSFFSKLLKEREENGIYKHWEDFVERTVDYWTNVEKISFKNWINGNVFRSLNIDLNLLIKKKDFILNYISLRRVVNWKIDRKFLPFISFKKSPQKAEKITASNLNEVEISGFCLSFFSRWRKINNRRKLDTIPAILSSEHFPENRKKIQANVYAIILEKQVKKDGNCLLKLQDVRSTFFVVIPSFICKRYENLLNENNEFFFKLRMTSSKGIIEQPFFCEDLNTL